MDTIITISGADKAGSLARILGFLAHKGYGPKGQQITELPSGSRLLKIRLDRVQVDKDSLCAEIQTMAQSVFVISAVVLVLLLGFNAWKAQRALAADL